MGSNYSPFTRQQGGRVKLGSNDETTRFWDTVKGVVQQLFGDHSAMVDSVTSS